MSVEVEERPVPGPPAARPGGPGGTGGRHGLPLHQLLVPERPPARPRPVVREQVPRAARPSVVAQRRRTRAILGLALLGTVPIVPLLGRWSIVSLTAVAGCLVVTYLDGQTRP
ncbi:hypothetical protein [Actinosynnema sp. NPDC023587]|uniref:hypothetical protein n=1 Tax=Actinosynnema sp. NPDC023587 TaxID=3154695 RepID=UPI0033D89FD3